MESDDCFSPSSYGSSFGGVGHHLTPETTPASSPVKPHISLCNDVHLDSTLDGEELDIDRLRLGLQQSRARKSSTPPKRAGVPRPTPRTPSKLRHPAVNRCLDTPDRFISSRTRTPTKERLLLAEPSSSPSTSDPFSPRPKRTIAINQFFTVIKYPAPSLQRYGHAGSSVARAAVHPPDPLERWTVAGLPVTEGIASTSNGRGGRVTSGTNAPLYNASMISESEHAQEAATFKQRLALAMEIDLDSKMMPTIQEKALDIDVKKTIWRDNQWQATQPSYGKASTVKPAAKVPLTPWKVLDAPELRNDYYCSLLAYCPALKCIAVALGNNIYIWCDPKIQKPAGLQDSITFPKDFDHITSISFSSEAGGRTILAIGRADGQVSLWNPLERRPRMRCDQIRAVSHVSFRPTPSKRKSLRDGQTIVTTDELLVGTEDGSIMLYSVEWPTQAECDVFDWTRSMMLRTIITCHTQQICGIAWSINGDIFATGGNDNTLFVHDFAKVNQAHLTINGRTLAPHQAGIDHCYVAAGQEKQHFMLNAAVKAIAFAPWQASLLAASGGSNDRCIHFLHTSSGARLATINCHAQVTSLTWHPTRKEIAATLGFTQPDHPVRIVTFAWPSCEQLTSIPWIGEERALYSIPYPNPRPDSSKKEMALVVATSDHSIKFHDVWHEGRKGGKDAAKYAKSQILADTCSEALESELSIR